MISVFGETRNLNTFAPAPHLFVFNCHYIHFMRLVFTLNGRFRASMALRGLRVTKLL